MMKLSRDYNGKPGKLIFHILGLNVHPNFINPLKWLIIFKLENINFWIFSPEKNLGREILTTSLRGSKKTVDYGDGTLLDQCCRSHNVIWLGFVQGESRLS